MEVLAVLWGPPLGRDPQRVLLQGDIDVLLLYARQFDFQAPPAFLLP